MKALDVSSLVTVVLVGVASSSLVLEAHAQPLPSAARNRKIFNQLDIGNKVYRGQSSHGACTLSVHTDNPMDPTSIRVEFFTGEASQSHTLNLTPKTHYKTFIMNDELMAWTSVESLAVNPPISEVRSDVEIRLNGSLPESYEFTIEIDGTAGTQALSGECSHLQVEED